MARTASTKGTKTTKTTKASKAKEPVAMPEAIVEEAVVDEVKVAEQNNEELPAETVEEPAAEEVNLPEIELLKKQNELLKAQLDAISEQFKTLSEQKAAQPTVVTYAADTERVHFLWEAPVAKDNIVDFGPNGMYGRIIGKSGSFYVPKADLSRIMSADVRTWIDKRWLIIISGLDEVERDAFNANYKEGEVLDRRAFERIVEMGDEILNIYPELCEEHKKMVAKTYYESWKKKSVYVKRETVLALYKIDGAMAFKKILEDMNAQEIEQ